MPEFSKTVALSNRGRLNGDNLHGAPNTLMLSQLGNPRGNYNQNCQPVTNSWLRERIVTRNVGPFGVTGFRLAVDLLEACFTDVKAEEPEVFATLTSAGMLCARHVRGSTSAISNHSWGCAIDLKIEGALDTRGDDRAQVGLLRIHPIFNRHGFYWGAGFPTEDAMHFEVARETLQAWHAAGHLGDADITEASTSVSVGDRSMEVRALQRRLNLLFGFDLVEDGVFGPATRAGVMQFQKSKGLRIDGIVGPKTSAALAEAVPG